MGATPVDSYLDDLDEPERSTLRQLRDTILEFVPEADQCLAYGAPAFKLQGRTVAGFAAYRGHLSYLPHSGSVLSTLASEVGAYETSKGALKFSIEVPFPQTSSASSSRRVFANSVSAEISAHHSALGHALGPRDSRHRRCHDLSEALRRQLIG